MTFYAHEFVNACTAGLALSGQEDGQPEWVGSSDSWYEYRQLEDYYDRHNAYKNEVHNF